MVDKTYKHLEKVFPVMMETGSQVRPWLSSKLFPFYLSPSQSPPPSPPSPGPSRLPTPTALPYYTAGASPLLQLPLSSFLAGSCLGRDIGNVFFLDPNAHIILFRVCVLVSDIIGLAPLVRNRLEGIVKTEDPKEDVENELSGTLSYIGYLNIRSCRSIIYLPYKRRPRR